MVRLFFSIFLVSTFTLPAFAYSQNYENDLRKMAVLINEVQALRDEVGQLKADVEALRAENAQLRNKINNSGNVVEKSELAAFKSEIINKLNAYASETDARFSKQSSETNAALKNVATQVNSALANSAKQQTSQEIAQPKDIPESGIEYTVRRGETLSKIARDNASKVDWILYANPGLKANQLQAGQKIIVPQK